MLTLTPLRFYTADDIYHYTVDNQPLEDIQVNLESIKTVLDPLLETVTNSRIITLEGNWTGLVPSFLITPDLNKSTTYRVKGWLSQDTTSVDSQMTYFEDIVMVGVDTGPIVHIRTRANLATVTYGATTPTWAYSQAGDNIQVVFTGYTGANGKVYLVVERYGI